jgi:hypothetical protein
MKYQNSYGRQCSCDNEYQWVEKTWIFVVFEHSSEKEE